MNNASDKVTDHKNTHVYSVITTVITIARASPRLMTIVVWQSLQLLSTLCDINWSVYQGLPTWGRRYGECKSLPTAKFQTEGKVLLSQ